MHHRVQQLVAFGFGVIIGVVGTLVYLRLTSDPREVWVFNNDNPSHRCLCRNINGTWRWRPSPLPNIPLPANPQCPANTLGPCPRS